MNKAKAVAGEPAVSGSFWQRYRLVATLLLVGFIGGFAWLVALRFFLAGPPPETHFHANFAVYIDGIREDFSEFTYYEEVAACSDDYADNPKGRVHMHDKVNDVIHVHDKRVTYGNFLENIGWAAGENFISARGTLYTASDIKQVRYILNGQQVADIADTAIGSTDRLLISYGDVTTDFGQQYESIASTAAEVNGRPDPAGCGGLSGDNGFWARLKRASFWQ